MKRILSLVLGIVMVLTMSVTAFAAEITGDSGSVDITYTYEAPANSYIITIPDSMTLGTDANVSVSDVVIAEGNLLSVSVTSQQYNDGWKLINGDDAVGYTLKIDGTDIENNGTVLTAKNGDTAVSKTLVTALSGTPRYSGNYTDTLTFNVSVSECENHDWDEGTCTICGQLSYSYDESSNTYEVYDAEGLLAWNEAARDNGSTNLALMKDIDMSDAGKWTPVGDYYYPYAGTIDGNNHTISNITLSDLTDDEWYVYVGFVGYMARDGVSEMKDITFDSPKISMTKSYSESYSVYVGIVGYMNYESTMTNVSVTGETAWLVQNGDCQGLCYIGGIAGLNLGGSISGCTSGANIRDLSDANSERYVGGIAGQCSSSGKINGCVFYGYLLASSNSVYSGIGGIVGYIQSSQDEIVGCYVTGTVTAGEGNEASVGTIAGYLSPTTDASAVKSCYWSGNDDLTAFGDCTEVDGTDVTWELAMVQMNDALDVAGAGVKYESSTENEKLPLVPKIK